MIGLCVLVTMVAAGSGGGASPTVAERPEIVIPAANRVDAAIFAPEIYWKARDLYLLPARGKEKEDAHHEALILYRAAEEAARRELPAILRNASLRFEAARDLARQAGADRDATDAYGAAAALAARADSVAADPVSARIFYEEAIDSLGAALWQAECARATRIGGVPVLPYIAYDACPFEGCCYRPWLAQHAMSVFARPDSGSGAGFQIAAGEAVWGVLGILAVTKLGRCRCDPERVNGEEPEEPPRAVVLLGYEGEGFYRALDRGRIVVVACDWEEDVADPEYVWWTMVQRRDGRIGWVAAHPTEELLFENQDAIDATIFEGEQGCP